MVKLSKGEPCYYKDYRGDFGNLLTPTSNRMTVVGREALILTQA